MKANSENSFKTSEGSFFQSEGMQRNTENPWKYYLSLIIFSNIAIWAVTLLLYKNAPRQFTSQWTAILPSTASNTNVNLPGIGNTSTQQSSPYSNMTEDPRENYKYLAESEPVLKAAASSLKMDVKEFGKPQIEIIDNTTLMNFQMTGENPSQAQSKATALYRALELNLNKLRNREMIRQEEEFQNGLAGTREKLARAQKRLSAYKLASGVVSGDQVTQLSNSIENLRSQRAGLISQWRQTSAQLSQLSKTINLSTGQAANAFALQADQQFQQNLKDYSDATTNLSVLNSQLGSDHPQVLNEKAKQEAARSALLSRSRALLGQSLSTSDLDRLSLRNGAGPGGSGAREDLFKQVVTTQVEQQGLTKQVQELDNQINQFEDRLSGLAQKQTTLAELERDVKISEAVFSSTLAKLDINRVDPLSAYPRFQTFTEPSIPESPSSPNTLLVLIGASLGSILVTAGLLLLWLRERKIRVDDYSDTVNRELETYQPSYESMLGRVELFPPARGFSMSRSYASYAQRLNPRLNGYQFDPSQQFRFASANSYLTKDPTESANHREDDSRFRHDDN
jgi:uncharacterized protein involved in exopolysaccharide biosynthesis